MQSGDLIEALYAIGIGMVVGLEREHSEVADGLDAGDIPAEKATRPPGQIAAGVRTLALLSLVGWLLAFLSEGMPWVLPIGLVCVAAILGAQIIANRDHSGITTEVAAIVVVLLGAVVHHDRGLAVALCLGTAMLLVAKPWMHAFIGKVRRQRAPRILRRGRHQRQHDRHQQQELEGRGDLDPPHLADEGALGL